MAINLVTNAVKFTPNGGLIVLSVKRNSVGAVELSVKDNGPGIPKDEIQQAMAPFTRGSLAAKKAIEGAGLGLPIVKGIMELHSGTIEIKSEVGKGSEFSFKLPRVLE